MKSFKYVISIILIFALLEGCSQTTLKAPCNATGSNCGPEIKINQWNNSNT